MRYSYEFKRKCVELHRQGKWPDTPEGVREDTFHKAINQWVRIENSQGPEDLRHKCPETNSNLTISTLLLN